MIYNEIGQGMAFVLCQESEIVIFLHILFEHLVLPLYT